MAENLFEPLSLKYDGLYADQHLVDAQQLGLSLIGAARFANSAAHFYFYGAVTHDPRLFRIRFYANAPKRGTLTQELIGIMSSGQLPLIAPILRDTAKFVLTRIMDATIKHVIGRQPEANSAIEAIRDLATQHNDFAKAVHEGHMRDKEWLQGMVAKLASENRGALRELPEPVGKSVRKLLLAPDAEQPIAIDEPVAAALRSKEPMEVGELSEYVVSLVGVMKDTGTCKLRFDDGKIVRGKITDPALATAGNIYTRALHSAASLRVTGKPTLKDGEVATLFVSNATLLP